MYDPTPSFSNLLILSQISHWKLNINQSDTFLLANIHLFLVKALFLYKERFGIKYLVIYLFPLLGFFRKWAKFAIQICNQSESIQNTALFGIFNVLIAVWNLSHVCESVYLPKSLMISTVMMLSEQTLEAFNSERFHILMSHQRIQNKKRFMCKCLCQMLL